MPIEQFDLFSYSMPRFKIDKPIRLIELFAGIGSQAKALKNLGVNFEHWKVIEFDQKAINSYNAVHSTNFTAQDITQTHANDLDLREREILLYSYIFVSMSRFITCWKTKRNDKRRLNKKWFALGS